MQDIGDENTNNRLERLWRSIKEYLKSVSSYTTPIAELVVLLVKYAEARLVDSYAWQLRHRMRIVHDNPEIMEEFDRASCELNDRGMKMFKSSLDLMLSRLNFLNVETLDGSSVVKERFSHSSNYEVNTRIYDCSPIKCNCSWSFMYGAPCKHILFIRLVSDIPLFHVGLFNLKFRRDRNCDLLVKLDNEVDDQDLSSSLVIDDIVDDGIEIRSKILSRGEKYKLLGPKVEMLLESMLRCGSNLTVEYARDLQIMNENVKDGKSLFSREEVIKADDNSESELPAKLVAEIVNGGPVENEHMAGKYSLSWNSKSKLGRVGRPRESKVNFKRKLPISYSAASASKKSKGDVIIAEPDPIVCSFPYNAENPRQNALYASEVKTLAPRRLIKDVIIDYCFRRLKIDYVGAERVLLIDSSKAQQLHSWQDCPPLRYDVESAELFRSEGIQLVIMAWCESSHFFGIVAVCDGNKPVIFVLESIGGYREPAGVRIMSKFLQERRVAANLPRTEIPIITPEVPRQPIGSNDCGIFLIENVTRIVQNPGIFLEKVSGGQLKEWYRPADVSQGRIEIAASIRKLSIDQKRDHAVNWSLLSRFEVFCFNLLCVS